MNDDQLNEISKKLDKIFGVIAIQNLDEKDEKIYALKRMGFTSDEISPLVGVKNVRDTKGWKRK